MSSPSLMSTLPSPLPFDSLLASSWTWLALCLATIATLLRALRRPVVAATIAACTLSGPALSSPPPPAAQHHHHCSSSGHSTSSYGRKSLHRHVGHTTCAQRPLRKKNRRSKSTSSLQKLGRHADSGGSLSSGCGVLSCLLADSGMPHADSTVGLFLRKASSFMEMCTLAQAGFAQAAPASGLCKQAAMARACGNKDETVKGLDKSEEGEAHSLYSWFPTWTYSLLDKLQYSLTVQAQALPPLFEKQFGWDSYLHTRLGSSWQCRLRSKTVVNGPRTIDFNSNQHSGLMESTNYRSNSSGLTQHTFSMVGQQFSSGYKSPVKVWSPQEKRLLKAMDIDESHASALYVGLKEGLACVGTQGGELVLYDIATKSCVNSVFSSPLVPISSFFIGSQNMVALAGGVVRERVNVLGLWDYRSPLYMSTFITPPERSGCTTAMTGLKGKGNQVCFAEADGFLFMYDLRMLNGNPFVGGLPASTDYLRVLNAGSSVWKVGKEEAESMTYLWDKLVSDAEDEYWDECHNILHDGGLTQAGGGGSFMLRCVNLFRGF